MEQDDRHIYRVRLDFLYRTIAVYATAFALFFAARALFGITIFPVFWQDPILILLCAITLASVIALLYNIVMNRQIEVENGKLHLRSMLRNHVYEQEDIATIQFYRKISEGKRSGVRLVRIRLTSRKRPLRIRPQNFNDARSLVHDLRVWAGPLAADRRARKSLVRRKPHGASPNPIL